MQPTRIIGKDRLKRERPKAPKALRIEWRAKLKASLKERPL